MSDEPDTVSEVAGSQAPRTMTVRGAVFLGVGAMVGAGIFALLGEAGAVAGSAVWVSFLIAGLISSLLGYAVVKLGVRYPSAGGILTYLIEGFGNGRLVGIASWLGYFSAILLVCAMVAVSFGDYAALLCFGSDAADAWTNVFASGVVVAAAETDLIEQLWQHIERLDVHVVERARQLRRRRRAITAARIGEDAGAGGGLQLVRKIAPQAGGAEAFVQHHDGRRVLGRGTDHAVFEIGGADGEEAGGWRGVMLYYISPSCPGLSRASTSSASANKAWLAGSARP